MLRKPHSGAGEAREDTIDHEPLDLVSDATAQEARRLRTRFEKWLRAAGASDPRVDDLALAVYEALANAVEHAYSTGHEHAVMRIQARLEDSNQVLITITDHGNWRTPRTDGRRGRGLAVMRHLAADVQLHATSHGTTVHLRAPLVQGDANHRAL